MLSGGKTLVCVQPGEFNYIHQPALHNAPDRALVKIKRVGICGTDLHAFEGTQPYFDDPRVLGHELAAEMVSDNIPGFSKGEWVTIIPYHHCGQCVACNAGKTNCCVSLTVAGVHEDGGMAEYISVPVELLVHGRGLSLDELALVEPLSIGLHGIRRASVQPGEFVLVVGAGPIGLGILALLRLTGAQPIALDLVEHRLQFCREKLGLQHTIHAGGKQVMEQLQQITQGDMPTVVIDATGSLGAINNSFRYLAHGGRYVLVGLQKEAISFSHPDFHKREATLMSSRNANRDDFETVMTAFATKKIDPQLFITHRVEFEALATSFPGWLDPTAGVIKAMVNC